MINILKSFMNFTVPTSDECKECDGTSLQHTCFECSNDCTKDCSSTCSDSDTTGLSIGVCSAAGKGNTESGCLFCITSYTK